MAAGKDFISRCRNYKINVNIGKTSKINICLNVRQVKFEFKFISQFCTVFPCNPCHCDDTYSPTLLSPHLQWHLTFTWRLAPPHIERHVGIKTSAIVTCRYFIRSNICHFWWFQLVRHVVICGVIRYAEKAGQNILKPYHCNTLGKTVTNTLIDQIVLARTNST